MSGRYSVVTGVIGGAILLSFLLLTSHSGASDSNEWAKMNVAEQRLAELLTRETSAIVITSTDEWALVTNDLLTQANRIVSKLGLDAEASQIVLKSFHRSLIRELRGRWSKYEPANMPEFHRG